MNERDEPQEQTLTQALDTLTPETIAQALSAVTLASHECAACRQCNEQTLTAPNALLLSPTTL